MKRFLLLLISSCALLLAYTQEEIVLDSIPREVKSKELNMEKPLLFENSFLTNGINLYNKSTFDQPIIPDYLKNLDFKKHLDFSKSRTESFSTNGLIISPFYNNATIFNQETYRLSDKFSFGGNSFGAQSVFDIPKINSSINEMSTKGASMFMQYKISKNLKVETRVSVTTHKSPLEP